MSRNIEAVTKMVDKTDFDLYGESYKAYMYKSIDSELKDRINSLVDEEGEIAVKKLDFEMVCDDKPRNALIFEKRIEWAHIVRCENCMLYSDGQCHYNFAFPLNRDADDFCSRGCGRVDV